MPFLESLKTEVERLMWFITIPQIISAPLSVFLIELITPSFLVFDILEILDFLVISFPLTLAVAIITYQVNNNESNIITAIIIIIGAALLSNLFHNLVFAAFPHIDVRGAWIISQPNSDPVYRSNGIGPLLKTAIRILGIYWSQFGIVMCIQALGIGIYAGLRYFRKS